MTDRIAIYLRLSKEDEMSREESNSISNQRDLIMKYIRKDKKLRKLEVIECSDDGYSGKNMKRPGMDKLLNLIRMRQINIVIVKDMSRFSRDYLVLGQYTEQIFPFMGVRFIAVNDNFDSEQADGGIGEIDVAFKAMLYDFYSEDLSQKIKTSLRVSKEQGKYMNIFAPYGYLKDPEDHHRLVIEPEGAAVVRRIFDDYTGGKSVYQIAKELNAEEIDSPAKYVQKRDKRSYQFQGKEEGYKWTSNNVIRILKNEVYIGTAVYNKARSKGVGSRRTVANPRSEWQRVENSYPAIISEEQFLEVSSRLKKNKRAWNKAKPSDMHYLTGKVICGGCGYHMVHSNGGQYGRPHYICRRKYYIQDRENCVMSIRDSDLDAILKSLIRAKIRSVPDMESICRARNEKLKKHICDAEKRLSEMRRSKEKMNTDLFQAYEKYKEGVTDKETYIQQKAVYEEMVEKLTENIGKQEKAIAGMERPEEKPSGKVTMQDMKEYVSLDREFSDLFIRRITVYADNSIDVIWNFTEDS